MALLARDHGCSCRLSFVLLHEVAPVHVLRVPSALDRVVHEPQLPSFLHPLNQLRFVADHGFDLLPVAVFG